VTVQIGSSDVEDYPTHQRRSVQGREASGIRVQQTGVPVNQLS